MTSLDGKTAPKGSVECLELKKSCNPALENGVHQGQSVKSHPRHPRYAGAKRRLETFKHWPKDHPVEANNLVTAGFFYTEHQDIVRCWYCDIGIRKWSNNDDPFVEHARWFSDCQFILQEKGTDFIRQVKTAHDNKRKMERDRERNDTEYKERIDEDCSEQIIAENAKIKKQLMCLLCGVKDKDVLFLPCSHLELCEECARTTVSCPRCLSNITQKIKTYRN